MLPLMVLLGFSWLGWWFVRHITGFPREFARLLENGESHVGPLSILTGRSTATGTLQGRLVTLYFQRAGEHQSGCAVVSMRTLALTSTLIPLRSRAATDPVDPDLEKALYALRDTHELRVEVDAGWIRVTWQPIGFFVFPGRFDHTKWKDVLAHMFIVASRLEVQSTVSTAPAAEQPVFPRALPGEDSVDSISAAKAPSAVVASDADHAGKPSDSPASSGTRNRFRGPVLVLRLLAALMILAGLSILAASLTIIFATDLSREFALATGGFAVIVSVTGAAVLVLAGQPPGLLINEGGRSPKEERIHVGGWLWLLLLTLVALPAWMVLRLSSLSDLWRDIFKFLHENDIWKMAQEARELSGLVVLPVVGVLSVPALELVTTLGIIVGAVVLVCLLVRRSVIFPRTFLLIVMLLTGWVASAQWATRAVRAFSSTLASEFFTGAGHEQALDVMARYGEVLQEAADTLTVVAVTLLVWTPALFRSRRVRMTFWRQ